MSGKELKRKAVTLCEGGAVWVSGLMVRAKQVPEEEIACQLCEMDSAFDIEMCDLCAECDGYDHHKHILYISGKIGGLKITHVEVDEAREIPVVGFSRLLGRSDNMSEIESAEHFPHYPDI